MKMRAAVMYAQGQPRPYAESKPFVIEEIEIDGPRDNEVLVEMRKVAWPTKEHVINSTVLVGVVSLVMVVMIGVVDKIFGDMVAMLFTR